MLQVQRFSTAQVLSAVVYRVVKGVEIPKQNGDKTYTFDLAYTGNGCVAVSVVHSEHRCPVIRNMNRDISWLSGHGSFIGFNQTYDDLIVPEEESLQWIHSVITQTGYGRRYSPAIGLPDITLSKRITQPLLKGYKPNGIAHCKSGVTLICLWNHAMGGTSHGMVLKVDYMMPNENLINLKIESDKSRKLFTCPTYITENGNGDICVSDVDAVVVTDSGGMLRFRYTGRPCDPQFDPYGICCDSRCNIIIADMKIDKIHMIDENGAFLHYIQYDGMKMPRALCIDEKDNLYVGEWNCNVIKVISRD